MVSERTVVAFQPHTFSRTKQLFSEFVEALSTANEIVLLDIFASAREFNDPSISSQHLAYAVQEKHPQTIVHYLHDIQDLAEFVTTLSKGDVFLTLGAGDIYKVHDHLS